MSIKMKILDGKYRRRRRRVFFQKTNIKKMILKKYKNTDFYEKKFAEKIKNASIERVIFDRNGYKYHGRVKALTEAIRSAKIII